MKLAESLKFFRLEVGLQTFEGLSRAGRKVRRLDGTLATVDHNVSVSSAPRHTQLRPGRRHRVDSCDD
jgi:homoaconitase/3-isopropylmalate dehydratase large subunit